jgi:hypothetical protein
VGSVAMVARGARHVIWVGVRLLIVSVVIGLAG